MTKKIQSQKELLKGMLRKPLNPISIDQMNIGGQAGELGDKVSEHSQMMHSGYAELGEFMVEFSQLEFSIRAVIGGYLKIPSDLVNPILSEYQFVSLCRVWKLLKNKFHPDTIEGTKKALSELLTLNEQRVRIAHGLWTPGVETLEASHIAKSSGRANTYYSEPGELKSLTRECQRLMQEVIGFKSAD